MASVYTTPANVAGTVDFGIHAKDINILSFNVYFFEWVEIMEAQNRSNCPEKIIIKAEPTSFGLI